MNELEIGHTITIYNDYMKLDLKVDKCMWNKSICPNISNDGKYPIYHSSNSEYNGLWFFILL